MKKINLFPVGMFMVFLFFAACSGDDYYSPKPRGYFRISLPEKGYHKADNVFPFTFEYPVYSKIVIDTVDGKEHWFNVEFPVQKAKLHFSYKSLQNNLYEYSEDTRSFVYKHVPKAEDITAENIRYNDRRVFALLYHIVGDDAASTLQFYVTDSTTHFLRGALYFEHIPNNDSIEPVIDFITEDVMHFIETLEWKY